MNYPLVLIDLSNIHYIHREVVCIKGLVILIVYIINKFFK